MAEPPLARVNHAPIAAASLIFATNHCNSNCVMCPDTEFSRRRSSSITLSSLLEKTMYFPPDTPHITITGGEPTLMGYDLIRLLALCRSRFNRTDFLLLSNGRAFADAQFTKAFAENSPCGIVVGIPLYAGEPGAHDSITQTNGSFAQAVEGAARLIAIGAAVEIRVVVMRQNYKDLPNIARFICGAFPSASRVHLMGLEMTGSAYRNRESVWVGFDDTAPYIKAAASLLISAGIYCQLYNFPLCHTVKQLWSLCAKSITPSKVRYASECVACAAHDQCGGFFASTLAVMKPAARPIREVNHV